MVSIKIGREIVATTLRKSVEIMVVDALIACGFPSPAQDYQTRKLDLTAHLELRKPTVQTLETLGGPLPNAGIFDGDLLIVDRARTPEAGQIVVVTHLGELLVRQLKYGPAGTVHLTTGDPDTPDLHAADLTEITVQGVVTRSLHHLLPGTPPWRFLDAPNLTEILGLGRPGTFLLRAHGHSMQGVGIFDGDELIIDRAHPVRDGLTIIAVLGGELTIKTLRWLPGGGAQLQPAHPDYPIIEVPDRRELRIWGVVAWVVHHV